MAFYIYAHCHSFPSISEYILFSVGLIFPVQPAQIMIWIELIILLAAILIGSRLKGIGLGLTGMVGLVLFVFIFHMRPTEPPLDVMLIILAIVTTAATLQAAGGLDYLVSIAEKIIRSNPSRIIFIGPAVVFCLALFAGTAHIVYSVLPIIAEVSAKKRI